MQAMVSRCNRKLVFYLRGFSAVWKKLLDATGRVSRQALEHVLETAIWVVTVELGGLDQAHDDNCTASRAQRTGEQPTAPV